MKNEFTPISIIPMRREAWRTPDFNPAANQRVAASGISPQTAAELMRLEQQFQKKPDVIPMGVGGVQKDPRATIQLPNGQFVTPEQYQQLLLKLKQRG